MNIVEKTVSELTEMERKAFNYFCFNYETMKANLEDNANYVDFGEVASAEGLNCKEKNDLIKAMERKELVFFADCDKDTYYISNLAVACWFFLNEKENYHEEELKGYVL